MGELYAKLSKICSPPTGSLLTVSVNLTAVASLDTGVVAAQASFSLPLALTSGPPQPAPTRISITGALSAVGNHVWGFTGDVVADSAVIRSLKFSGAGTINGRKQIKITDSYDSRQIYSNGLGGFYTLSRDGVVEAVALINCTMSLTALGDGDTQKTRTATISIKGDLAADLETVVAVGTILLPGRMDAGGDIDAFIKGTTTVKGTLIALGELIPEVSLNNSLIIDSSDGRHWSTFRAFIQFTGDGYVERIVGSTGLRTKILPDTDWISPKSAASGIYSIRATLLEGIIPQGIQFFGSQTGWVTVDTNVGLSKTGPFWEIGLTSTDNFRTSRLQIDLSDDGGATILASAIYTLTCNLFDLGEPRF